MSALSFSQINAWTELPASPSYVRTVTAHILVSETAMSNEHEGLNTDELRQRRLYHYGNVHGAKECTSTLTTKKVLVNKINRLHIKENLMEEFQEKQVTFKLIILKFIQ